MKSLQEFKLISEEEKQDFTKFDALVRAGLANKAQLQRLHKILSKMSDERPNFSPADRAIIQNVFSKMVDLITNNPQINRQARKAVAEGIIDTADFKLDATGRKIKAHKFKLGKDKTIEESIGNQPPFVLILKRTAIRLYPNGTKVATYYSQRLNKEFAVPFSENALNIQSESYVVEFDDGESVLVDFDTASVMNQAYELLNNENKDKFANMMHESLEQFEKAKSFAFSKVEQ